MRAQNDHDVIAGLAEAAELQEQFAQRRLELEWGQVVFGDLARIWDQLQTHECLAYEDKVQVEVHLLEEATSALWRLHRKLARIRRLLQQHQQHLRS